jgi:hypothetical protein
MTDIKAEFYLQNWERIEEWAALRTDADRVLDVAMVSRIERVAEQVDADLVEVLPRDLTGGAWPRIGLAHRHWRQGQGPRLGVYLEWNRRQLFKSGGNRWPYTGVRVAKDQPLGRELRTRIRTSLTNEARALGWTQSADMWPVYGPVEPNPGPMAADVFADQCAKKLLDDWSTIEGGLDNVWRQLVSEADGHSPTASGPLG